MQVSVEICIFGVGTLTEPVKKSHKIKGFKRSIDSITLPINSISKL